MQRRLVFAGIALLGVFSMWQGDVQAADERPPAEQRAEAAIRWKLPHEFTDAVAAAKKQKRILIIKGVSFGIDEAGAKCATKGKW